VATSHEQQNELAPGNLISALFLAQRVESRASPRSRHRACLDVDSWWLISGEHEAGSSLPAERRVGTLNLLSELGATLTLQRRLNGMRPASLDGGAFA